MKKTSEYFKKKRVMFDGPSEATKNLRPLRDRENAVSKIAGTSLILQPASGVHPVQLFGGGKRIDDIQEERYPPSK